MLRFISILIATVVLLTACSSPQPDATLTEDPTELLRQGVEVLRTSESFQLSIDQGGVPYRFVFQIGSSQSPFTTTLERADGTYAAPGMLDAQMRMRFQGVPINVDIFANDEGQWIRGLNLPWQRFEWAPGFNPAEIMADGEGFDYALGSVRNAAYLGEVNRFGVPMYHIRGEADGDVINELLFGVLEIVQDLAIVDVYLRQDTLLTAEMVMTLPNTAEGELEDTFWRIEIFDRNEPVDIDLPTGATSIQATPETEAETAQ